MPCVNDVPALQPLLVKHHWVWAARWFLEILDDLPHDPRRAMEVLVVGYFGVSSGLSADQHGQMYP